MAKAFNSGFIFKNSVLPYTVEKDDKNERRPHAILKPC